MNYTIAVLLGAWMMKIFQVKYKMVRGYNTLRKYVGGY